MALKQPSTKFFYIFFFERGLPIATSHRMMWQKFTRSFLVKIMALLKRNSTKLEHRKEV